MIRRQLPGLVSAYAASEASTRARLGKLKLETQAGREVRDFNLYLLDQWGQLLPAFASDVASKSLTWHAVDRFGRLENMLLRKSNVRLGRMIRTLSPAERKVVERAMRETFGG